MDQPQPAPLEPGDALEFDADAFRAAVQAGVAAADGGDLVPHEDVREWLLALARGERPAAPPAARR